MHHKYAEVAYAHNRNSRYQLIRVLEEDKTKVYL